MAAPFSSATARMLGPTAYVQLQGAKHSLVALYGHQQSCQPALGRETLRQHRFHQRPSARRRTPSCTEPNAPSCRCTVIYRAPSSRLAVIHYGSAVFISDRRGAGSGGAHPTPGSQRLPHAAVLSFAGPHALLGRAPLRQRRFHQRLPGCWVRRRTSSSREPNAPSCRCTVTSDPASQRLAVLRYGSTVFISDRPDARSGGGHRAPASRTLTRAAVRSPAILQASAWP